MWQCTAALLGAIGVSSTAGLIGWGATWWLFIGATMFGWLWSFLWLLGDAHQAHRVLEAGPTSALMIVIGVGLLDLLGPAGLIVIGALVVTHPAVFTLVRVKASRARNEAAKSGPTAAQVDGSEGVRPSGTELAGADDSNFVVPDAVTTADLCRAWCSSYVALHRAQSVRSLLNVVEMRALYLDELERRMGKSFVTWMNSGPRAAQNPRRFLSELNLDES